MAIKLSANYSKKLGLPQYSSHSFSASVEVELTDITQVETEVQKLYALLQQSVDQEIQHTGFIPGSNGNGNGHGSDHHPTATAAYPPLPGAEPAVVALAQRGTKAPAESPKLSVLNPRAKRKTDRLNSRDAQFAQFQSDSPACDVCGAITVRNGNCYLCHECGSSMGCS